MAVLNQLPYRPGPVLGQGVFATTYAIETPQGPAVLKLAHAEPLGADATKPTYLTEGVAFVTGGVGPWEADPSAVVAAEGRMLAGIAHPAFVKLLAQGTAVVEGRERAFLVLERLEGRTWREAFSGESPPTAAHVRELARALSAAHAAGALPWHGDLKPENLFLDPAGRVRVIDPSSGSAELEPDGTPRCLLTTPWYNPTYAASDMPALGLLLMEALAGRQPLRLADTAPQARRLGPGVEAWLNGLATLGRSRLARKLVTMPMPSEIKAGVPADLEAIALRCLGLALEGETLERAEPFADVAAFARALEA